jgi:hypothetical protein
MNNSARRPATVWIAQVLLLTFALVWMFSLTINLLLIARDGTTRSPLRVAVGAALLFGVVLLMLTAFWGLARKRVYGKWLGVLGLIILWAAIVYTQIRPVAGPIRQFEYNSKAELVGASITAVLISIGFLTLIVKLAFAKRVAAFFDHADHVASSDDLHKNSLDRSALSASDNLDD